jgi:hypothetical protein
MDTKEEVKDTGTRRTRIKEVEDGALPGNNPSRKPREKESKNEIN